MPRTGMADRSVRGAARKLAPIHDDAAAEDNRHDRAGIPNVFPRLTGDEHEIGELSSFHRPEDVAPTERERAVPGGREQDRFRRRAGLDEACELVVVSPPLGAAAARPA